MRLREFDTVSMLTSFPRAALPRAAGIMDCYLLSTKATRSHVLLSMCSVASMLEK